MKPGRADEARGAAAESGASAGPDPPPAAEPRQAPDSRFIYLFFTTRSVTVNNSYLNHRSKGMT